MTITASQIYARQAPRKVRLVANTVKSMPLAEAFQQLGVMDREASILVMKVLRQAVANATHNHGLSAADLVIKSIRVDQGATYKRFRAVSRGRAHSIQKKTCHVTVELSEKTDVVKAAAPVVAAETTPVVAEKTVKTVAKKAAPAAKKAAKAPVSKTKSDK
ncbi:50S ribosomal protein L22 [Candidatus Woesebacteria bacterium]|nr:50S ribosomal protein L22 [Candidatus Woesebacteria bacterium]